MSFEVDNVATSGGGTTGSGTTVLATSPTLVTPVLGDATVTTVNKVTITQPAASATLTIANTKTLTVPGTVTLSGVNYQASPADPTGTNNTTGLMMGLAGAITPIGSGKVLVIISGDISSDTVLDGGKVQIRMGTGTAPANGDALTGTAYGGLVRAAGTTANTIYPFSVQAIVPSLTPATAYWVDVGLAAVTGGTAVIKNISISAVEV